MALVVEVKGGAAVETIGSTLYSCRSRLNKSNQYPRCEKYPIAYRAYGLHMRTDPLFLNRQEEITFVILGYGGIRK